MPLVALAPTFLECHRSAVLCIREKKIFTGTLFLKQGEDNVPVIRSVFFAFFLKKSDPPEAPLNFYQINY